MDKSREGDEDIFKKSRKTVRSPNKEQKSDKNEIERLGKRWKRNLI